MFAIVVVVAAAVIAVACLTTVNHNPLSCHISSCLTSEMQISRHPCQRRAVDLLLILQAIGPIYISTYISTQYAYSFIYINI